MSRAFKISSSFVAGFAALAVFLSSSLKDPNPKFPLFDPQAAPAEIKDAVVQGQRILLETKKLLPEYAGDKISCTNCHFAAGNTFGGPGNGLSLVGVSHLYPKS